MIRFQKNPDIEYELRSHEQELFVRLSKQNQSKAIKSTGERTNARGRIHLSSRRIAVQNSYFYISISVS
jgi:hypothetical protein